LRMNGYTEFLPLYRKRSRWSDRVKDVDLALFPGYIFGKFEVHRRLPILAIARVTSIVGGFAVEVDQQFGSDTRRVATAKRIAEQSRPPLEMKMVGAWPTVRNELVKSLIIKDGAKVRQRYFRKSTYQLQPVRQVRIPKAGKPGEFRMLVIRTIYDRV